MGTSSKATGTCWRASLRPLPELLQARPLPSAMTRLRACPTASPSACCYPPLLRHSWLLFLGRTPWPPHCPLLQGQRRWARRSHVGQLALWLTSAWADALTIRASRRCCRGQPRDPNGVTWRLQDAPRPIVPKSRDLKSMIKTQAGPVRERQVHRQRSSVAARGWGRGRGGLLTGGGAWAVMSMFSN